MYAVTLRRWTKCHYQQYEKLSVAHKCFYGEFTSLATIVHSWGFTQSVRYFCPTFTKFRVSRQIALEVPNIKFHGNLFSKSRADTRGGTDRHDEDNWRFSRLCGSA